MNRYTYAMNAPVNYTDPLGLAAVGSLSAGSAYAGNSAPNNGGRTSGGLATRILGGIGDAASSVFNTVFSGAQAAEPGDDLGNRIGARAAISNAQTGNPRIDTTTARLTDILQQSAAAQGSGRGPLFGIRVHSDFGARVKAAQLPGIPEGNVEQSFSFGELVTYGTSGSVRTDVTLNGPDGRPLAIYDVKTGGAVITPDRAKQLRENIAPNNPDFPIIELRYNTLESFLR